MATAKRPASASKAEKEHDAIVMLTADHKKVKDIFKRFETLKEQDGADEEKAALAQQVCSELKIHAQIEEEIFYPAARAAIDDDDLMDEANVEHTAAKELIAEIEVMEPGDDLYDAKVTVLGEQIDHHATEEEEEMFPKVKKAKLDTAALGLQMYDLKMDLMEEMGLADESRQDAPAVSHAKKNGSPSASTRHHR